MICPVEPSTPKLDALAKLLRDLSTQERDTLAGVGHLLAQLQDSGWSIEVRWVKSKSQWQVSPLKISRKESRFF